MSRFFQKKSFTLFFFLIILLVPVRAVFGQSTPTAQIGFFTPLTIPLDTLVEVPIEIKGIDGLFALDITVHFDPAILTAEDADPAAPGIQMALGQFLDPGLVVFNTLDNVSGTGHFVMTQVNPSEAKSGDGILLVITFRGLKEGESDLRLENVQLSTRDGNPIASSTVNTTISVDVNAPPLMSTPIPIYQSTQMIMLPTPGGTRTPTITAPSPDQAETVDEGQPVDVSEGNEVSVLLGKWWLVAVLLVLVVAAGTVLWVIRKKAR